MALRSSSIASLLVTILFWAILVITPSFARVSVKVTKEDLEDLCKRTNDPSFCLKVFQSDPRTATADFFGVVQISIDLARTFVKETSAMIDSLAKNATDRVVKAKCSACLMQYGRALNDLEFANESFNKKKADVRGIYMGVLNTQVAARGCDREFEAPQADQSSIRVKNRQLHDYGDIISLATARAYMKPS